MTDTERDDHILVRFAEALERRAKFHESLEPNSNREMVRTLYEVARVAKYVADLPDLPENEE